MKVYHELFVCSKVSFTSASGGRPLLRPAFLIRAKSDIDVGLNIPASCRGFTTSWEAVAREGWDGGHWLVSLPAPPWALILAACLCRFHPQKQSGQPLPCVCRAFLDPEPESRRRRLRLAPASRATGSRAGNFGAPTGFTRRLLRGCRRDLPARTTSGERQLNYRNVDTRHTSLQ